MVTWSGSNTQSLATLSSSSSAMNSLKVVVPLPTQAPGPRTALNDAGSQSSRNSTTCVSYATPLNGNASESPSARVTPKPNADALRPNILYLLPQKGSARIGAISASIYVRGLQRGKDSWCRSLADFHGCGGGTRWPAGPDR